MLELQKLAGDSDPAAIVQFSGDENHLFFKLGDRLLLSRKLTGNFPDYERVLPKDQPQFGDLAARRVSRGDRTRGAVFRRTLARDSRACRRRRSESSLLGF